MEITLDGIKTMIAACENDLQPSPFTQTAQELMTQQYEDINTTMMQILDKLAKS
jgi:hypothetical protein